MHQPIALLTVLVVQPILIDRIEAIQYDDPELLKIKERMQAGMILKFNVYDDRSLWFEERICIPNDLELKKEILSEAHESGYAVHPRSRR